MITSFGGALVLALLFTWSSLPVEKTEESHLTNLRQLTFGGDNAEAYFSFDGRSLVFQSSNPDW